jgi:cytochrome bd-type quinol oxidase subunit 2
MAVKQKPRKNPDKSGFYVFTSHNFPLYLIYVRMTINYQNMASTGTYDRKANILTNIKFSITTVMLICAVLFAYTLADVMQGKEELTWLTFSPLFGVLLCLLGSYLFDKKAAKNGYRFWFPLLVFMKDDPLDNKT